MNHRCPGPGCEQQIPYEMLACRQHWYQGPRAVRNAVYRAWNRGLGAGSAEHLAAMDTAIRSMRPIEVKP